MPDGFNCLIFLKWGTTPNIGNLGICTFDCLHVGNCPCCNSGLSFEPRPLLHILFGLNLLTSCKNSATSGSTCLSNIPLYACRTSSTCWIVTTKFHTFYQTALRFGPSVTLRFQTLNFKAIFGIAFLCFV